MRHYFVLIVLLLMSSPLFAQIGDFYLQGTTSLHYQQYPFGSLSGDFLADGELDTTGFDPTGISGCMSSVIPDVDSFTFTHLAVAVEPDSSLDLFGIYLSGDGEFGAGAYDLSPLNGGMCGLILGADSLLIPDHLDSLGLVELLNAIQADWKFVGAMGELEITTLQDTLLTGTFELLAIDPEGSTMIQISEGVLDMRGADLMSVPSDPQNFELSAFPNPFNPTLNLRLDNHHPQHVQIRIWNLLGKPVQNIYSGYVNSGIQHFTWQANGMAAGVYLLTVETPSHRSVQKVSFLP